MPARELRREDLAAFDLSKYQSRELFDLSLAGWCQVLEDRMHVRKEIKVRKLDTALQNVARFFANPLHVLGAGRTHGSPPHETDTPSIRLIRVEQLQQLAASSASQRLDLEKPFDLAQREADPVAAPRYAHIRIDLDARRRDVEEDFGQFLDRAYAYYPKPTDRPYGPGTFREWVSYRYLPYYDLDLYARALDASISQRLYVEVLQLRTSEGPSDSDLVKTPRKSLREFSEETLAAMMGVLGRSA